MEEHFLSDPSLAIYSTHVNDGWSFNLLGTSFHTFGTYSFMVRPSIIFKEGLSFGTVKTDKTINNCNGYFDTGNWAHIQLLKRNYSVISGDCDLMKINPTLFATSSGYRMLYKKKLFSKKLSLVWSRSKLMDLSIKK